MKRFRIDIVLLIVALVSFGAFGYIQYDNFCTESKAANIKEEIMQLNAGGEIQLDNDKYVSPYASQFAANEDMVAWIKISGTVIDYPVMQTKEDEEYYLYRDFFGNDDKNGTLFMDADCDLNSENPLIHGHHMRSGNMFGGLADYLEQDYQIQHSDINIYTKEGERTYKVIAVLKAKVLDEDSDEFAYYNYMELDTEEKFNEYYKNIKGKSVYDTGVTAEFGDEFITLSTCSYHAKEGRLAVIAKKIK